MKPFNLNALNVTDVGKLTEEEARQVLEAIRWPNGPICPHCKGNKSVRIQGVSASVRAGLLRCGSCGKQFTVTIGTIFEDSHIPLRKWLLAITLMCSSKKGISALQLKRNLDIGSYQTAWFMAHRIRYAITREPLKGLLSGTVEADETWIGGREKGRQGLKKKKTPVVALVERDGRVRAFPMQKVSAKTLRSAMRGRIDSSARIMTDENNAYGVFAGGDFAEHQTVNHSKKEYVRGEAYTNTAESFFSLLKRGIHGAFHHVSKHHLHRYCDEFSFRWDHRKDTDSQRMVSAVLAGEGKHLVYQTPKQREARA